MTQSNRKLSRIFTSLQKEISRPNPGKLSPTKSDRVKKMTINSLIKRKPWRIYETDKLLSLDKISIACLTKIFL